MILEWDELDFPHRYAIREMSSESFLTFTRLWFEIVSGDKLMVNWHHRMMASKIDQLVRGELNPRNLIFNIPPGGTKTEFFSIHLPAYVNTLVQEGRLSRFRNLNLSYADTLVKRNSRRTRDIIASPEYQELWPCTFGTNQAEEWQIVNDKGRVIGETVSKSVGGQVTGGRGGYYGDRFTGMIMLDDYNKPDDMFSETKRTNANVMLTNTVRSRRGDKSKDHPTPVVSIQQRLHTDDATGFMMSGGMGMDFHHVSIPALVSREYIETLEPEWRDACWECVKDSESVVVNGVEYWSYWPDMEYVGDLMSLWEKDEYTFVSQYMQNPRALTGGLINPEWFMRYEQLPPLVWRGVYADTAQKKGEQNDFSVFEHWGLGNDGNAYLIDVVRGKWDSEELMEVAEDCWRKWKDWDFKKPAALRYMAIEDKASGTGLIQTLKKRAGMQIKEIPRGPGQNKIVRCLDVQSFIKSGNVYVPATHDKEGNRITHVRNHRGDHIAPTSWVPSFLAEAGDFSSDDSHKHDDQLDPMFDALADMLVSGGGTSISSML